MKMIFVGMLALVLCGCEESPERKLARKTLEKMEEAEALGRIESATMNKGLLQNRLKAMPPSEGDKLDLARWDQEMKEADEAAEKKGLTIGQRMEAMKAGYEKAYKVESGVR